MARFISAIAGTGAGSTTLPIFSVYSPAGSGFELREAACFNTTTTAARERLQRLTTAGTPGAGQTEAKYDDDSPAAAATAFTTHSVGPTLGDGLHVMPMGAAIGAGSILTFYDRGIECAAGTANGIGIIVASGTGQIADVHMVWDE